MLWFVPTTGDGMFLGVQGRNLTEINKGGLERKLGALAGRVQTMPGHSREWRGAGRALRELGALSEAPESLEQLATQVFEDTAFAEFAMMAGAENPYRRATPDEEQELERMPLGMWPLRLMEGGLN